MDKKTGGGKLWQWKAPEFPYYKKGRGWLILMIALTVLTVVIFMLLHYYLAAIAIALAATVIYQQAHRQPKHRQYQISAEGVKLDDRFYPFDSFQSFWISVGESNSTLYLENSRRFALPLIIHLGEEDIESVYKIISVVIPEKPSVNFDFGEQMLRWLRL